MDALHLLIDKLSSDFKEIGDVYAHKSFHRVEIIRIDFTEFSGKSERKLASGNNSKYARATNQGNVDGSERLLKHKELYLPASYCIVYSEKL